MQIYDKFRYNETLFLVECRQKITANEQGLPKWGQ